MAPLTVDTNVKENQTLHLTLEGNTKNIKISGIKKNMFMLQVGE